MREQIATINKWIKETIKIVLTLCFIASCFYGCELKIGDKGKATNIQYKMNGLLNKKS